MSNQNEISKTARRNAMIWNTVMTGSIGIITKILPIPFVFINGKNPQTNKLNL